MGEAERIDSEIAKLRSYGYHGPYRKGIIAGLEHRKGGPTPRCPAHYKVSSAVTWAKGFESGLFRDLRTYDERMADEVDHPKGSAET